MSPADDILVSEAGFFYRRIVSAVSTAVSKTTSVGSNPTAPVYLRSIMEECNGLLIRFFGIPAESLSHPLCGFGGLQVRVLSQILIGISEEILVAPALRVWYGSVAELVDCGSPLRS